MRYFLAIVCMMVLALAPPAWAARQDPPLPSDSIVDAAGADLYARPSATKTITPQELEVGPAAQNSSVSRRIADLEGDLRQMERQAVQLVRDVSATERADDANIRDYYARTATIMAQLQAGTTPANPRLVAQVDAAQESLDRLSSVIAAYTKMARQSADIAARGLVLSREAKAAFALPGAVEEDHVALAILQDSIARSLVSVERVSGRITQNLTRASRQERTERPNLRTLSLAVSNGDLYAAGFVAPMAAAMPVAQTTRPLMKIADGTPEASYTEPLNMAVREALARYPHAAFEVVASYAVSVKNDSGKASLAAAGLDRQAARVATLLGEMNVAPDRVRVSARPSGAGAGEVYLYLVQ